MEKDRRIPAPQLPNGYAELANQPELVAAWEQEVAVRRAEAVKIQHLLAYRARKTAENSRAHVLNQRVLLRAVYRDAAVVLGVTEASVRRLLDTAEFLRQYLPHTWDLYLSGQIDYTRAAKAASAVGDLVETTAGKDRLRGELLSAVDREIADRAPNDNQAVLGQWLTRRIAELDTAGHQERCTRAKARRRVDFNHCADGMSRVDALLPTVMVAPIEQELHAAVRNMPRTQTPDDCSRGGHSTAKGQIEERTYSQRMADVFAGWLMDGRNAEASSHRTVGPGEQSTRGSRGGARTPARISILIPAETLTGDSNAPAVSEDRSFTLPAEEARRIADDPDVAEEFYGALVAAGADSKGERQVTRVVKFGRTNPVAHLRAKAQQLPNLLESASEARFFSGNLRRAVLIRDGTCQATGCAVPAHRAEIDHRTAYDSGGATSGRNSVVLCRDHHAMKGLGLLPTDQKSEKRTRGTPAERDEPPDECPATSQQAA